MIVSSHKFTSSQNSDKSESHKEPIWSSTSRKLSHSSRGVLQKSVPLAASAAILLWSSPVDAGILSGFSGLESMPGPELPRIDFLNKFNEDNQKKYADFDSRFKSSTVLKELLEKSKVNKEKSVPTSAPRGGAPTDSGDSVVTLDQIPRWSDVEHRSALAAYEDPAFPVLYFSDPLTAVGDADADAEGGVSSIAMGCVYTETKNYPREPAAHVAIRTVRRFLEKQKDKITAVVFCTTTSSDTEIYKRLLPLYFPRDKHEEEVALSKLPADVGDENGETVIDERKIRIKPLPAVSAPMPPPSTPPVDLPVSDVGLTMRSKNSFHLDSYLDPAFMSLIKDPDQRRMEQLERAAQMQSGWNCAKFLGFGDLGGPPLSAAEEYSLHARYIAKANSLNLSEIAEMKIVYRGGVDSEGRPVMVVVGAHFLLRCLDLEQFVLYVVKEFEPLLHKPYTIVYFHSAASLQVQPDLGWMKRLQQILGRKHQRNLHAIYVLHPTLGLKTAILALQLFVDGEVWRKVVYIDRLVHLFRYVPREQLTIPDFVFQHDLEVNGGKGVIVDPRTKYIYHRPSA
ncbi:hypothetical protein QJS10_CPB15g01342 [Acorus calamus]|uniref:CRAL-TRIO domain-containing protein n=1 Tax=Acorus calamus TaxID=4465 RepID=A0AAV9D6A1_ACOCL|nr:hypothetical protein QJS10_CPB15g01342 [Acorus calamus]